MCIRDRLSSRESWAGLTYARKQADVFDPEQFKVKKTSTMQQGTKVTEYYAINFKTESGKIRIADGIKSKKAAKALKKELIERCFQSKQIPQQPLQNAS